MAIYHCSVQVISRGQGRSAVAAVAYRSGTVLENEYTGLVHDFTNKKGVIGEGILLPEHVPEWYQIRSLLWNEIEKMERSNAQLAREFETSIPIEIPEEERVDFAFRLAAEVFVKKGLICDIGVHDRETDGTPNPHVHITSPMRPISADGTWEAKSEQVYVCKNAAGKEKELTKTELAMPENAEWMKQHRYSLKGDPKRKKVYLTEYEVANNPKYKDYKRVKGDRQPKTAKYGRKNPTMEYWDSKEFLLQIRKDIADFINAEMEARGLDVRVDHRSLKDQGIDREPTIHEGHVARKMEKEGIVSDRCETNREIRKSNAEMAALSEQLSEIEVEIGSVREDITWNEIHQEASEIKDVIWDGSWSEAAQQAGLDRLHTLVEKTAAVKNEQSKSPFNVGAEIEGVPYLDYHAGKAEADQTELRENIKTNTEHIRSIPVFENFRYGTDPLWQLNEKLRATTDAEGKIQLVERTPAEQALILDAKKADHVLAGRVFYTDLPDLIAEQDKARKSYQPAGDETAQLIRQAQDDFTALHFVERHGIKDSEDARRCVAEIERRYRRQYGTIRRLEAQQKKLHDKEKEVRTGAAQGNLKQIYAELNALKGKIENAKNQLPELSREVKEARCCAATFDRIEGRTPDLQNLTGRAAEAQKKNQEFEARQGMWAELKSCNNDFWVENKRLSQVLQEDKNKGYSQLKSLHVTKANRQRVGVERQYIREVISAATQKQEKLNMFREAYRTTAEAAKTALLNGMNEEARRCLDRLQEMKARQIGYYTGDVVQTKVSWVNTTENTVNSAYDLLDAIKSKAKEIQEKKTAVSHEPAKPVIPADVDGIVQRIADLCEAALVVYGKSLSATTYTPNTSYQMHADRLLNGTRRLRQYEAEVQQYTAEIKKLGILQPYQRRLLKEKREAVLGKIEDEKYKMQTYCTQYRVDASDPEMLENLINNLYAAAQQEAQKAELAKQSAGAKERYKQLKAELLQMVESIPDADKPAVLAKLNALPQATTAEPGKRESVQVAIERSNLQRALQTSLGEARSQTRTTGERNPR